MMFQHITPDYATFAVLLDYPTADTRQNVLRLMTQDGMSKPARKYLQAFADATERLSLEELQELHTRTFDLSPLCSPALSVHLFGVESFKRSHLMVGLLDQYRGAGFSSPGETADNMVTVLKFLANAPLHERLEIVEYIVIPAFKKMASLLQSKENTYGDALRAAEITLASESGKEHTYA